MKVAIHQDSYSKRHNAFWSHRWEALCQEGGIDFEVFDFCDLDLLRKAIDPCDIFLFHFDHYHPTSAWLPIEIIRMIETAGKQIFPNSATVMHFNDKARQSIALQSVGAPTPDFEIFTNMTALRNWLDRGPALPVVAKLRVGSGSNNVRLLTSRKDVTEYGQRMLNGRGFSAKPSLTFKAKSNIMSTRGLGDLLAKARRIPEFIRTLNQAKLSNNERGYVYLQSFIPNDGFDAKIVTINNRAAFFTRHVRPRDFRASGRGAFTYESDLIDESIVVQLVDISKRLGFTCMGYDVVIDRNTGQYFIIEMSFGFSHFAIEALSWHWILQERSLQRIDIGLDTPAALLEDLLRDKYRQLSADSDLRC